MTRWTVHEYCEQKKITCEQLAARCGLTEERTEAIYMGRWTPSPEERVLIARGLEVEIDAVAWGHLISPEHFHGQ